MPELPTTLSIDAPGSTSQSSAQARAARTINAELIGVYWQIGHEILQRQAGEGDRRGRGGPKIVERLSVDLRAAFQVRVASA